MDHEGACCSSPTFLTSPDGYAFQVEIYLHGHAEFRGTHVYAEVVQIVGPNDEQLQWLSPEFECNIFNGNL